MSEDFFKQLDEALSNVGADQYWERIIGGRKVWLSSVPFKSQHKINEILTNESLGTNVIGEVKRMTMSYAIVGFDDFDLRQYRNETPVFPIFDPRERKQVKVSLNKYLYHKINEWGTEWVDSAFEVFADIMDTVKKDNLKEVKFENAKDKREELAEFEEKVKDLRNELGLPPLVEFTQNENAESTQPEDSVEPAVPPANASFNPFNRISEESVLQNSEPVVPVPVPIRQIQNSIAQDPVVQRPISLNEDDHKPTSSIDRPHVIRNNEVIESRPSKESLPIEIDPIRPNVNPRFKQPSRQ
jgi:hypothetical protein